MLVFLQNQLIGLFIIFFITICFVFLLNFFYRKFPLFQHLSKKISQEIKLRGHYYLIIIAILFLSYYLFFALYKYYNFYTDYDLIEEAQPFWNLAFKGNIQKDFGLYIASGNDKYGAGHFSPTVLLLFAPFIRIFHNSSLVLIVGQAILLFLALIPFYFLAKKHFKISRGIIFLLCFFYLISPGLQSAITYDFHSLILFPLLFFSILYFYFEKKNFLYWSSVLPFCFVREDFPLFLIFLGIFFILQHKDYRKGITTILCGIIGFILIMYLVYLLIFDKNFSGFVFYSHLGTGPIDWASNFFKNPLFFIRNIIVSPFALTPLIYYLLLLLPFIFKSWAFILFIPFLSQRILSGYSNMWIVNFFHYEVFCLPLVMVVMLYGLNNNKARFKKIAIFLRQKHRFLFNKNISYILIFVFLSNFLYILPFSQPLAFITRYADPFRKETLEIISNLPEKVSVATTPGIAAHIVHTDRTVRSTLVSLDSQYLIIPKYLEKLRPKLTSFYLESFYYEKIMGNKAGILLKRTAPYNQQLAQELYFRCKEEFYIGKGGVWLPSSCSHYFYALKEKSS
jgi:uncharacterized membrane protein